MNYWSLTKSGLDDCAEPFFRFVYEVVQSGKKTAKVNYGCGGSSCNHNVDIWRKTTPVKGNPCYMYAPLCGAWLANEVFSHYKNGKLLEYKEQIEEIVTQTAQFCNDYLEMCIRDSFIAGIMAHVKGIAVFSNPTVNSYKRLVPGYEAPTYITWSASNRSSLVRIPASRGKGTRIELRSPDPTCNPYLEMALCLAAGLDGIKRNLQPVAPIDFNVFNLSKKELDEKGIELSLIHI